ncbi:MAG: IS66 family transposase [bacterium]|nr:IS66 family transposase [bacterium]
MKVDLTTASREEIIAYAEAMIIERDQALRESEKLAISNKKLKARIAWYQRQYFGAKSERVIPQDPRQLSLFEVPENPPSESTSVKSYERKVRKTPTNISEDNMVRFSESVPVDEVIVLPTEVVGLPESAYEVIGEKVTERLVQIPCQYRVKRTIRKTVKIKETKNLHTAPAPDAVIEKSFADVTFLAGMITDKFLYHLPLYRQHQRLAGCGVNVSRGHLTKLTHRTLELLEPVYLAILSSVADSDLVCMDETPIKASRQEKGKMKQAYFWPVHANEQVAFIYSSSRATQVIKDTLGSGCKRLLSDGFAAYESYAKTRDDLVHAQCWAHVRRNFFDAQKQSPHDCHRAIEIIRQLFAIEERVNGCGEELRLARRREESLVLVNEFFESLEELWFQKQIERGSPLGTAVQYAREREQGLRHFLSYPDIPLSNNHVERAIRPVAVGRKNWLFFWTEVGAKYAAIAYTLIESCKMQAVNPWDYLVDVLPRIDTHPAQDVHLLAPKHWKAHFANERKTA